jgi:hypothetical protein
MGSCLGVCGDDVCAAYAYLLREQSGEQVSGAGQWWTDYQACSRDDERQTLMEQLDATTCSKRKRRKRRPRKRPDTNP